jgi:biopolymer transport protein ExbD
MAIDVQHAVEDDELSINTDLNVVPLTDVMLVMLIIFLVTIPVIVKTVPVQLPTYRNIVTVTKPENIVIAVDADENVYYNNQPIDRPTMRENFVKALRSAAAGP